MESKYTEIKEYSLAALLEHDRIEDEDIIQVYMIQILVESMLEGLAYLHSRG
jgi:mitogen-activated protein kinase kinase kinase